MISIKNGPCKYNEFIYGGLYNTFENKNWVDVTLSVFNVFIRKVITFVKIYVVHLVLLYLLPRKNIHLVRILFRPLI